MVDLVGNVSPSFKPTKYTAAPGADGVGPPVWPIAASDNAKVLNETSSNAAILLIIEIPPANRPRPR
jgi:hypothetical protein